MNPAKIERNITKKMSALLSERDESIKQSFINIEQNIRQALGMLEFKLAVAFTALEEAGIPKAKLDI